MSYRLFFGQSEEAAAETLWLSSIVLDNGLAALADADKLYLCSDIPTTYAEATATYALGNGNSSVGSPGAHGGGGREVTVDQVAGSATGDGTPAKWALVDTVGEELLAVGSLNAVAITNGQGFTLEPMTIAQLGVAG